MYIESIAAGFMFGLIGSLHCAAMCGPIVVSIPWSSNKKGQQILLYHLGRISTYALMGVAVGILGKVLWPKTIGIWPSIISALVLIAVFVVQSFPKLFNTGNGFIGRFSNLFRKHIKKDNLLSRYFMGMLNGILPCGMVYMALAASLAVSTKDAGSSALFMLAFGVGTSPLLVFLQRFKMFLSKYPFFRKEKTVRYALLVLGLLFLLRGAQLGIPYVSPVMKKGTPACCASSH